MTTYNDQSQQEKQIQGDFPPINQAYPDEKVKENEGYDLSYGNKSSEPEIIPVNYQPNQAYIQPEMVNQPYPPPIYPPYQLNQPYSTPNAAPIQYSNFSQVNYPSQYNQPYQQFPNYPIEIPANSNPVVNQPYPYPQTYNPPPANPLVVYPRPLNQEQNQGRWGFLRNVSENSRMKTANNDRKSFIVKVYALLCCQLIFTAVFVGIVCGVSRLRDGIKDLKPLVIVCWILTVVIMIAIFYSKKYSKRYPYNYLALFLFTLFESYVVAFVCAYYEPLIVLFAAVSTLALTLTLTIYAWRTRSDFTTTRGCIIVTVLSLAMFGFWMIWLYSNALYSFFCLIVILLYGYFLVYDTQLIAGGRYRELTYDDYVIGAVLLYTDIIILFLYILSASGKKN
ncbi:unnamed protein product [Blepharisma stoltei]|uniref:Uncharacterized protein n=1 Tax=Blepharisma stoltei TaxID=1481888 RepID=A0AAU9IMD8_9CILI|nr:unnamed protein product [Blepharisma stoltei]